MSLGLFYVHENIREQVGWAIKSAQRAPRLVATRTCRGSRSPVANDRQDRKRRSRCQALHPFKDSPRPRHNRERPPAMTLTELISVLFPPGSSRSLTSKQAAILDHPHGPAWVMAGPGSGKTEVLTLFVLRLLYVSGDPAQLERVPPESIF